MAVDNDEDYEVYDNEEKAPDERAVIPEGQAAIIGAQEERGEDLMTLAEECDPDDPEYDVLGECEISSDVEGEGEEDADAENDGGEEGEESTDEDEEPGTFDEIKAIYEAKKDDGIIAAGWAAGSAGFMKLFSKFGDIVKGIWAALFGEEDKDGEAEGESDESDEVADESGVGAKIIAAINASIEKGETGFAHCWDWVNKKYAEAGIKLGDSPHVYKNSRLSDQVSSAEDPNFDMNVLKPGCHVIYHNGNIIDKWTFGSLSGQVKGDHSGVFVKWIDKGNMIAEIASFGGPGKGPPRKQNVDLKKWPVQAVRDPRLAKA